MTYAGANGNTATEMADAMNFTLPSDQLHTAFNWLDLELNSRGEDAQGSDGEPFRLKVVNATWGQKDFNFLQTYLDTLALNYGAGLWLLDFINDPEGSRETINSWVEEQTEDKIEKLLPEGSVSSATRLVLTNAVYFNAAWASQFQETMTQDGSFNISSSDSVTVPMMQQTESFQYYAGTGYEAVELFYDGWELSMVILVPDAGTLSTFEAGLSTGLIDEALTGMTSTHINLKMPRFEFKGDYDLVAPLRNLGMNDAFTDGVADFSGIDGTQQLVISGVVHKTFVSVNESGTEAAAATGVTVGVTSVPPPPIDVFVDRPFIFMIRDIQTKTIVFMGRVVNPG